MNKAAKATFGAIAVIGLAVTGIAMAHNSEHGYGPAMMDHGKMGGKHCDSGERATEHLSSIKEQLNLTDAQAPSWQAFETAVTTQMESMTRGHEDHSAMSPKGESHDMEKRIAFMEQRLAGMKTVLQAREDLYAVLTPEQKATADKLMQHDSHFGHHGHQN